MKLFGFEHHQNERPWDEAPHWAIELREIGLAILLQQETIMIDTTRILAAVARERTEAASLRALNDAKDKIIADTAAALKAAMDAGSDPGALAKVQADLDKAATDLDTDSDAADAAIKANAPPAAA